MRKSLYTLVPLTLCFVLFSGALVGCASSDQASSSSDSTVAESSASSSAAEKAATPFTAADLKEGTYEITVDSSSSMFKITHAEITVQDGQMTCAMTLSGTGYEKLFMGTSEQAAVANEDQFHPFFENADGAYTYTVPVSALDTEIACAAFSIKKQAWYDRTVVFESASLPADAFNI